MKDEEIYEPETDSAAWRLNALRAQMDSEINSENHSTSSIGLISLKDIILKKDLCNRS